MKTKKHVKADMCAPQRADGDKLKNYTDVLIFQLRVCAGATNSKSQNQI